jgi:hypothetical protein
MRKVFAALLMLLFALPVLGEEKAAAPAAGTVNIIVPASTHASLQSVAAELLKKKEFLCKQLNAAVREITETDGIKKARATCDANFDANFKAAVYFRDTKDVKDVAEELRQVQAFYAELTAFGALLSEVTGATAAHAKVLNEEAAKKQLNDAIASLKTSIINEITLRRDIAKIPITYNVTSVTGGTTLFNVAYYPDPADQNKSIPLALEPTFQLEAHFHNGCDNTEKCTSFANTVNTYTAEETLNPATLKTELTEILNIWLNDAEGIAINALTDKITNENTLTQRNITQLERLKPAHDATTTKAASEQAKIAEYKDWLAIETQLKNVFGGNGYGFPPTGEGENQLKIHKEPETDKVKRNVDLLQKTLAGHITTNKTNEDAARRSLLGDNAPSLGRGPTQSAINQIYTGQPHTPQLAPGEENDNPASLAKAIDRSTTPRDAKNNVDALIAEHEKVKHNAKTVDDALQARAAAEEAAKAARQEAVALHCAETKTKKTQSDINEMINKLETEKKTKITPEKIKELCDGLATDEAKRVELESSFDKMQLKMNDVRDLFLIIFGNKSAGGDQVTAVLKDINSPNSWKAIGYHYTGNILYITCDSDIGICPGSPDNAISLNDIKNKNVKPENFDLWSKYFDNLINTVIDPDIELLEYIVDKLKKQCPNNSYSWNDVDNIGLIRVEKLNSDEKDFIVIGKPEVEACQAEVARQAAAAAERQRQAKVFDATAYLKGNHKKVICDSYYNATIDTYNEVRSGLRQSSPTFNATTYTNYVNNKNGRKAEITDYAANVLRLCDVGVEIKNGSSFPGLDEEQYKCQAKGTTKTVSAYLAINEILKAEAGSLHCMQNTYNGVTTCQAAHIITKGCP